MNEFSKGRPFAGSPEVRRGKLRGMTDGSEHFFFLCPRCADNTILQILDFEVMRDTPVTYDLQHRAKAKRDFKIAMKIHCLKCKLMDFVEISNDAWQGGKITNDPLVEGPSIY
jgi:phage FluMu protein Com